MELVGLYPVNALRNRALMLAQTEVRNGCRCLQWGCGAAASLPQELCSAAGRHYGQAEGATEICHRD